MKKLIILFTVAASFCISLPSAHGQAALLVLLFGDKVATEKFHFGLKIGGNLATLSGIDDGSYNAGLNFGLAASLKLNDKLFLAPEFLPVSRKGMKDIPPLITGNAELDALLEVGQGLFVSPQPGQGDSQALPCRRRYRIQPKRILE
jgi:hypothetical protein